MEQGSTHVVIDDALRQIYRACRPAPAAPPEPARAGPPVDRSTPAPTPAVPGRTATVPMQGYLLRRDGLRPLRFTGTCLLHREVKSGAVPAAQCIAVYATETGDLIVQAVLEPAEGAGARPVHSVGRIASRLDFAGFVAGHDPGRGVVATGPGRIAPVRALRHEFERLADAVFGAAPLSTETQSSDEK